MAKRKTNAAVDIDWYLISIERLKQIGLVVFLLILGGAVWWNTHRERGNPKTNAESAIADARQTLNSLAKSKDYASHKTEFDRSQRKLDEATNLFATSKYGEAQEAAVESQTISRTALSGGTEGDYDAQFLTVEGDVQFQKSSSDWKKADARTALFNGDWVKTGDGASAELMFQNGSLYTIGPNAMLEIYSAVNPSTSRKTNAVQMQFGAVEIATTSEISTIRTPGTQVVVDSDSTTQVGVDKEKKSTSVVAMKGSSSIAPAGGGESLKINSGEKVSATATGTVSPAKKLAMPPALLTPGDNQVFPAVGESRIDFLWAPMAGVGQYQLQVSRSRLFSSLEINSKRQKPSAAARVSSEGTFYWRVASVGADGEVGPFSQFRRFRVSGASKGPTSMSSDTKPPALVLKAPFNIGGQFYIIEGTTEAGSTVFINDEEVDVESNGHFKKLIGLNKIGRNSVIVKAVDPAGNQTVQSQTVLVEE
jgi:hypothetical protein